MTDPNASEFKLSRIRWWRYGSKPSGSWLDADRDPKTYAFGYMVEYNGKIFDILLSHNTLPGYDTENTIEGHYLQRLHWASNQVHNRSESDEEEEEAKRAVLSEIKMDVFRASDSIMQDLAPDVSDPVEKVSLYRKMYPGVFNLQLVTKQGKLEVVKRNAQPVHDFHPPIDEFFQLVVTLKGFTISVWEARRIQFLEYLSTHVVKVLVNGKIMCAKLNSDDRAKSALPNEIHRRYEILATHFDLGPSLVKVPRINGMIINPHPSTCLGFVMDYIPSLGRNLKDFLRSADATNGIGLRKADGSLLTAVMIDKARKLKWY